MDLPGEGYQQIHSPDSSDVTSESVDLKNLDSTDCGCAICLLILVNILVLP